MAVRSIGLKNRIVVCFIAGLFVVSTVACDKRNNTSESNRDNETAEEITTDSIGTAVAPDANVAEWNVYDDGCSTVIKYPGCQITIFIDPEYAPLDRPMLIQLFLLSQKSKAPYEGQYTLHFGDLHPIKGQDDLGTQWHIEGEDAKKALEIMDKGSFTIKAVNEQDGHVHTLTVVDQTKGALEAYNKTLNLFLNKK